ncbi:restriction endonuclease subunit S [Streptomyces albogriseolus]|uniref:restriction endonuclease subunit S n=1 Tax=Streptomyces albogriseolus TaxID=1887 RepID=UPI00382FAE70
MSTPLPWGDTQPPWTVGQVKHLGRVTLGKMLQAKDTGQDVLAPYMRAANVQPDGVLSLDDVKEMWFAPRELDDLTLRRGDVVVVEGGQGGFGRAAYVGEDLDGWGFQNSINRIRPRSGNDGRFLAYYLIALRATGFIRRYCNVVSMPHLTAEKLAAIALPLPSGSEQRAIADHLDRETSQIDTLIAAQQRFVGLLEERREAVIRSAIPVPGQSEWKADKLGRRSIISNGATPRREEDKYWRNGDIPWLNSSVVNLRAVVSADQFVTSNAMTECHLPVAEPNDILVGLTGQGKTRGMATILKIRATISQHLACIHADRTRWAPEYLLWALKSAYRDLRHASDANGATKGGLTVDALKRHVLVRPPLAEQRRIVDYLNEETAKTDALIAKTQRHIELARERRIALITAAVTGQIDITKGA